MILAALAALCFGLGFALSRLTDSDVSIARAVAFEENVPVEEVIDLRHLGMSWLQIAREVGADDSN
jgi:hypothetical protein